MNSRRVVKGQTVVIVALCALALLAFVGLAVDGGSTLLQRRTMQNGADAGALAAVQAMTAPGIAVS
ncbi:MAG TPA: pilus assembly protein TadG-related protein, partial [Chloroflexia bacterium]